jgi:hypothetical protein
MKTLVIGGTGGIGKELTEKFLADAVGSSTDLTTDQFLETCKDYDLIINCLPSEYQYELAVRLFDYLNALNKKTHIITFGSTGCRTRDPDNWKRKTAEWNDQLTVSKSSVKHTLLNISWAWNSPEVSPIEKLSKKDIDTLVNTIVDLTACFHITELTVRGNFPLDS